MRLMQFLEVKETKYGIIRENLWIDVEQIQALRTRRIIENYVTTFFGHAIECVDIILILGNVFTVEGLMVDIQKRVQERLKQ
jgi:hypothetical protein